MNDVMIIFKIEQSFLTCELQMSITGENANSIAKDKEIQFINHYLYELERSPYGILSELALIVQNNDSRISFANQIHYYVKEKIESCKKDDQQFIEPVEKQKIPFVCSNCCKYYRKYENILLYYQCTKCRLNYCMNCCADIGKKEMQKKTVQK